MRVDISKSIADFQLGSHIAWVVERGIGDISEVDMARGESVEEVTGLDSWTIGEQMTFEIIGEGIEGVSFETKGS